jgi:excisionase family DNA binding protein
VTKEWYTLDEAAEYLECSKRHVRRLVDTGQLKAYRVGRGSSLIRIHRSDLERVMCPVVPSAAS